MMSWSWRKRGVCNVWCTEFALWNFEYMENFNRQTWIGQLKATLAVISRETENEIVMRRDLWWFQWIVRPELDEMLHRAHIYVVNSLCPLYCSRFHVADSIIRGCLKEKCWLGFDLMIFVLKVWPRPDCCLYMFCLWIMCVFFLLR